MPESQFSDSFGVLCQRAGVGISHSGDKAQVFSTIVQCCDINTKAGSLLCNLQEYYVLHNYVLPSVY